MEDLSKIEGVRHKSGTFFSCFVWFCLFIFQSSLLQGWDSFGDDPEAYGFVPFQYDAILYKMNTFEAIFPKQSLRWRVLTVLVRVLGSFVAAFVVRADANVSVFTSLCDTCSRFVETKWSVASVFAVKHHGFDTILLQDDLEPWWPSRPPKCLPDAFSVCPFRSVTRAFVSSKRNGPPFIYNCEALWFWHLSAPRGPWAPMTTPASQTLPQSSKKRAIWGLMLGSYLLVFVSMGVHQHKWDVLATPGTINKKGILDPITFWLIP